ncbi:ejaculatory bulb-specific protein 3-like [Schistocerca americana]|nr:ejaculatory bulb-specific protein 3-like [Schistocerca americana]
MDQQRRIKRPGFGTAQGLALWQGFRTTHCEPGGGAAVFANRPLHAPRLPPPAAGRGCRPLARSRFSEWRPPPAAVGVKAAAIRALPAESPADRRDSPQTLGNMARSLVVLLCALAALAASENPLLSQLENIDVDAVLADPERVDAAVKCFLSDTDDSCNTRAKVIKGLIAETLKTNCAECSDNQKAGVAKFMAHIAKNKPEEMKQLLAKYDPKGEALAKYGDSWREKGIIV